MWWRRAKAGFGGGVIRKRPGVNQVAVSELEKTQIDNKAQEAAYYKATSPLEMTTEQKLRDTPNRGGTMNIPPKVNPYQDTEASLSLSGKSDWNAEAFRPDQHHRDGYGNYGGYDDQPPISPDIANNHYPV